MESLLNKYTVFKDAPEIEEYDDIVKYFEGNPITKGVRFVLRVVKEFNNLVDDDTAISVLDRTSIIMKDILKFEHPHVFKVSEDTRGLLMKTDTEIKYQPLPYHTIFIDEKICVAPDVYLYGLFAIDLNPGLYRYADTKEKKEVFLKPELEKKGVKAFINFFGMVKSKGTTVPIEGIITDTGRYLHGIGGEREGDIYPKGLLETLSKFLCAFLDFVNQPDIDLVTHTYSDKQKRKAEKRGGFVRSGQTHIKLTGKLKAHVVSLKKLFPGGKIDWSHAFWVRGHFMRFKSERYSEEVRGTKKWKLPFIKGTGKIIKKDYVVRATKELFMED